jgi:putative Mg2+ transporter-C (MgtC) family protein
MIATVLTLGTLSVFRWVENRMPAQIYAQFVVRFARNRAMPELEMRRLLNDYGFTVANLNYRLDVDADFFEYQMVIRTTGADNTSHLTQALNRIEAVKGYRVSPTGD